jgi:hypothetical protein
VEDHTDSLCVLCSDKSSDVDMVTKVFNIKALTHESGVTVKDPLLNLSFPGANCGNDHQNFWELYLLYQKQKLYHDDNIL